jgi:hypothetical protein
MSKRKKPKAIFNDLRIGSFEVQKDEPTNQIVIWIRRGGKRTTIDKLDAVDARRIALALQSLANS